MGTQSHRILLERLRAMISECRRRTAAKDFDSVRGLAVANYRRAISARGGVSDMSHISRLLGLAAFLAAPAVWCSDHLDTNAVKLEAGADIGDLYAWMSPDGRRVNLVMAIVGGKFSEHIDYRFHIDSGRAVGDTTVTSRLTCRFAAAGTIDCRLGTDRAHGAAGEPGGLWSMRRGFRIFVGLRDDPFFNNVYGTRAALNVAGAALAAAPRDGGGCPRFDDATVRQIAGEWRRTNGQAAENLLAGWKTSALVVSIELDVIDRGGPLLGVWATTQRRAGSGNAHALDRMGRVLTGNALLGTFDTEAASDARKHQYNHAQPAEWPSFAPDLAKTLAIYDGFDGECGNQWLAVQNSPPADRYLGLARLLADDRVWVNSRSAVCTQYLAAEFDLVGATNSDCGGRTPAYDAVDVFRSLLATGETTGLDDGVARDDRDHSNADFPFLAAP
jgi:hypothetical protein